MVSNGVVTCGQAYGIHNVRVGGHGSLIVYSADHFGCKMAISERRHILISVKREDAFECKHGCHSRYPVSRIPTILTHVFEISTTS